MEQKFNFTIQVLDFSKLFYEILIVLIQSLSNRVFQENRQNSHKLSRSLFLFLLALLQCCKFDEERIGLVEVKQRKCALKRRGRSWIVITSFWKCHFFLEIVTITDYDDDK